MSDEGAARTEAAAAATSETPGRGVVPLVTRPKTLHEAGACCARTGPNAAASIVATTIQGRLRTEFTLVAPHTDCCPSPGVSCSKAQRLEGHEEEKCLLAAPTPLLVGDAGLRPALGGRESGGDKWLLLRVPLAAAT